MSSSLAHLSMAVLGRGDRLDQSDSGRRRCRVDERRRGGLRKMTDFLSGRNDGSWTNRHGAPPQSLPPYPHRFYQPLQTSVLCNGHPHVCNGRPLQGRFSRLRVHILGFQDGTVYKNMVMFGATERNAPPPPPLLPPVPPWTTRPQAKTRHHVHVASSPSARGSQCVCSVVPGSRRKSQVRREFPRPCTWRKRFPLRSCT